MYCIAANGRQISTALHAIERGMQDQLTLCTWYQHTYIWHGPPCTDLHMYICTDIYKFAQNVHKCLHVRTYTHTILYKYVHV